MIVSNTSPIICLGKEGKLDLFKIFKKVIISQAVFDEVAKKENSPEAIALKKAIEEKWIKVEKIKINDLIKDSNIGKGEKEAISLAFKHSITLILDDDTARSYASIMGVEAHGTLYVLILAKKKKILKRKQAIQILDSMISNGFYISTEVYKEFFELY